MSKTRDTGYLANVIQVHDTGVRIMSGSEMLMEISSSGAVTITGELSGSDAANALLLSGTGSVGFTTTGSFTIMSSSLSSRTTQIESVYATTGSNSFRATQSITGSLTVTGQIIAQTLNVQQVTSSIIYSSGSNVFGCDLNSRQTFTGSVNITGSLALLGNMTGNAVTLIAPITPLVIKSTNTSTMWTEYYYNISTLSGYIGNGSGILSGANNSDFIVRSEADFVVAIGNNRRMTITCCGIGIATQFPSASLQVAGCSTFGTSAANGDVTIISNSSPFVIRGRTTYDRPFLGLTWDVSPDVGIVYGNTLKFNVNTCWGTNAGTTALTILANSKVGIGETCPDNTYQGLTIKGSDPSLRIKTTSASGWVWTEYVNSSGTNNFSMGVNQTSPYFGIKAGAGMDNVHFAMDSSGNIGMGTSTPCAKLDVRGTSRFWHGNTTNYTEFNNSNEINHYSSNGCTAQMYLNWLAGGDVNIARNAIQAKSAGNVGIGESASTIARLNVNGSTKMNRSFYNWYQGYWTGNSTYWHMKTNMWAGGSPNGNIQYTMSLFKGYFYSYSDPSIREGTVAFHNWVAIYYALVYGGNLFSNVYTSSDGYTVLVIPSGSGETGVTIDWHQAYGYPFVNAQVTAAKLHSATTGGY